MKQITKICDSCINCGLPKLTCICGKKVEIISKVKFIVLSYEKELLRPSNTARLFKLMCPHNIEIIKWQRTEISPELKNYLENDKYKLILLFPAEDEVSKKRVLNENDELINNDNIIFIILDGTWKEARKIFRKSPYLNNLPLLSLKISAKSNFSLRRGIEEGNICTIETMIHIIDLLGEHNNAMEVHKFYNLFLKAFDAGRSGHKMKLD